MLLLALWFLLGAQVSAEQLPVFVLQTARGKTVTGPLQTLGEDWSVRLGGADAAQDLLILRRTGRLMPPFPADEQLLFVNGDRIAGRVLDLAGEQVHFQLPAEFGTDKVAAVPLSALSVIWLVAPDNVDYPDQMRRRLAVEQRPHDTVYLRNGDVLEGLLTGLDEHTLQVEVDRKVTSLARPKVAAIALSTELAAPLRPKGAYGRLVLADGSRVSVSTATSTDGKVLTGTTLFGAPVRLNLDTVEGLALHQGAAVYLSDLKPTRSEFTPWSGQGSWPVVNDGSVTQGSNAGRDLRLAGSTYDKGIGMHSASRLTYDLGGRYQRFEALVGIDDQAAERGSVRLQVLVDGKAQDIGWNRELTGRDAPLPVKVEVTGARELTLVVDFGRQGDALDRVDWVDARLVK